MCSLLIRHCDKGYSVESFAAIIDCTPEVFPIWARKFPDFEIAMHVAYWKSYHAMEKMGLEGKVHHKTYEIIMRNRFNWKHDTEDTLKAIAKMNTAQLEEMARRILETDSVDQISRAKDILHGSNQLPTPANDQRGPVVYNEDDSF